MPLPPASLKSTSPLSKAAIDQRSGDDHRFVVESFVLEDAARVATWMKDKLISLRDRGADFFGVGDVAERKR
jgi:hypothetical protein